MNIPNAFTASAGPTPVLLSAVLPPSKEGNNETEN